MHDCPDCGIGCHCNGDIDDLLLNDDDDVDRCNHCPLDSEDDDYDPGDDEDYLTAH